MSFIIDENETAQAITENSPNCDDVVKKFEKYRSRAEVIYAEYNEAKLAIDRLREEINLCQTTEKCYSRQILSLKNQLSILEEKRQAFFTLSKKQRIIDESIQNIDERITQINNIVQELKANFQNVISSTNKELDLINENRYLKAAVQNREESLKLIKSDMEKLLKEKEELTQQNLSQNSLLNEELRKSKLETDEMRDFCTKSINSYRKQIEKYKDVIQKMENERKRIFEPQEGIWALANFSKLHAKHHSVQGKGDYETSVESIETCKPECSDPRDNEKTSAKPDSTLFPETRDNKSVSNMTDFNKLSIQTQPCIASNPSNPSTSSTSSNSKIQKTDFVFSQPQTTNRLTASKSRKVGMKQRAKLEFFQDREETNPQVKPKRRLYSENNNHYLF